MRNSLEIHGYLGRDPELKDYKNSKGGTGKLVNFSVGVSRDFGEETDWFDVTMFGKRAEVIDKFFRKGSQIFVWGRMQSKIVQDDEGKNHKYWKLIAEGFDFCDSKESARGSSNAAAQGEPVENAPDSWEEQEGDIPF